MAYVPTGFPLGRPRKGEIRPATPGSLNQARVRQKKLEENAEEWRSIQAMYQQFYKLAFPEKVRESRKKHRQRERHWQAAEGKPCKVFIS